MRVYCHLDNQWVCRCRVWTSGLLLCWQILHRNLRKVPSRLSECSLSMISIIRFITWQTMYREVQLDRFHCIYSFYQKRERERETTINCSHAKQISRFPATKNTLNINHQGSDTATRVWQLIHNLLYACLVRQHVDWSIPELLPSAKLQHNPDDPQEHCRPARGMPSCH